MTVDEIRALLKRRDDAFKRRDAVGLAADYSGDCVLMSRLSGTVTGRAAVENISRGEDWVLACLQSHCDLPAAEQLARLFETLREFTDHTSQRDDVTALVLRYIGGDG